jgi:DNA polymerase-3 subunit delta
MFYIFHGEDEFSRAEALADLKSRMGDPAWLDLNTNVLDGRKLTLPELIHTCDAIPFFGDRRLVIIEGLLVRFDPHSRKKAGESGEQGGPHPPSPSLSGRGGAEGGGEGEDEVVPLGSLAEELIDYLGRLPETTRLIFVEPRTLKPANPVLRYAQKAGKKHAYVKAFTPPKPRELDDWIRRRVVAKGGSIAPSALTLLEAYLGNDLRLVDGELDKLLTFVGPGQPITEGVVRQLVAAVQESSIFDLVDAIGLRDQRRAMTLLEEMLDAGQPPTYLMTMIVRQFRILLQLKELNGQHLGPEQLRERTGLHSFVVEKGLRQARNFSLEMLESIYGRLVELDAAMKTGRIDPALGLEVLVAELCG